MKEVELTIYTHPTHKIKKIDAYGKSMLMSIVSVGHSLDRVLDCF